MLIDKSSPISRAPARTHPMPRKTALLLLALLLCSLLGACRPDPNVQFIQGTWEIAEAGERFFQWTFERGTFSRAQEVDGSTSLLTTGRYRVVQSDGDLLELELSDYEGDRIAYENNPMTIRIEIDREAGTLTITNIVFTRQP